MSQGPQPGDDHELHTLTGAYALGALDHLERRAFEHHLAGCEACTSEVAGLLATAARLGASAEVVPPPELRAAVLAEVARTRQERVRDPRPGRPATQPGGSAARSRRWPALVAAAAVLLVAGLGGGIAAREHQRADRLQAVVDATAQVYAAPDARTSTTPGGGGTLTVVASRSLGRAVVIPHDMAVPAGRSLQLWVMHGGSFRSVGLMGDQPMLADGLLVGARLGITAEPPGGSARPTSAPLVEVAAT